MTDGPLAPSYDRRVKRVRQVCPPWCLVCRHELDRFTPFADQVVRHVVAARPKEAPTLPPAPAPRLERRDLRGKPAGGVGGLEAVLPRVRR